MYYIVSIRSDKDGYYSEVYHFNIFAPFRGIYDGTLGLSNATNYSEDYEILYPKQYDDNVERLIDKTVDVILEGSSISKWMCVFIDGKYDFDLTYKINNDKAILIADKNELENRRRTDKRQGN